MHDNGDSEHRTSDVEDFEAERQEVAELVGRLLAWDWLERRRAREPAPSAKPEGHHPPADRSG